MHELSLAQAIADAVDRRAYGCPVRRVDVRIGYLRQVVPDALVFAWEMITESTDLGGAKLVVDHVPAVVRCGVCHAETTLDLPVLACRACEGHDVELLTGEEFQLISFDVAERHGTSATDQAVR